MVGIDTGLIEVLAIQLLSWKNITRQDYPTIVIQIDKDGSSCLSSSILGNKWYRQYQISIPMSNARQTLAMFVDRDKDTYQNARDYYFVEDSAGTASSHGT